MGDIRLTPFNDIDHCVEKVKGYVQELNNGEAAWTEHGNINTILYRRTIQCSTP